MTNTITKGIVTCRLNKNAEKPEIISDVYEAGGEAEVAEWGIGVEEPDWFEGIPIWYKLSSLAFIPRKLDLDIV